MPLTSAFEVNTLQAILGGSTLFTHGSCSTNSTSTITDAAIQTYHKGLAVSGSGIPAGSYVGTVTAGVSYTLSSSPSSSVAVSATATAGSLTLTYGLSPAQLYVGLLAAASWSAGKTGITVGQYYVGTAFGSANPHIFKATAVTTGITGGSEPAWSAAAPGQVFPDNGVTWTECTLLFQGGTWTGSEPTIGTDAYARVNVANTLTNFPAPTAGPPAQVQNASIATFPTVTGTSPCWGQIVGFVLWDAATGGNAVWYGLLSAASLVATVPGTTPDFAASGLTFTLN